MNKNHRYQTSWTRVAFALFGGGMIAGATFVLGLMLVGIASGKVDPSDSTIWSRAELEVLLFLWVVVSGAWLVGLLVLGVLPWIMLHRSGHRHWKYAVAIGLVIVPLGSLLTPISGLWAFLLFAPWGAGMGWVVWRIAYFETHAAKAM